MIIIGEKINGTRETVGKAIKDRNTEMIEALAMAQVEGGAEYLDVNAGTHPHEEPQDMAWLVETIQSVTKTRLCLDSTNPQALLKGIQSAERLPMINSVSGERIRVEGVLPIACEHGTDLVLLALDDNGIPETTSERLDIVGRLVSMAREGGLRDDQLFVDPLITTIATQADSGGIAIETIREIRAQFPQVHIICGLSNISFGQPSRTLINQAFAALAIEAGLDSAIMDPADQGLRNIIYSTELVLGADPDCLRYNQAHRSGVIGAPRGLPDADVDAISDAFDRLKNALSRADLVFSPKATALPAADPIGLPEKKGVTDPEANHQPIEELVSSLVEMKRDRVLELTESLIKSQTDPLEILGASRRAMGEVGRLFEEEAYFIPELILAGKMLKDIAERVKPHLTADVKSEKKGRVLIGTVAGDIHDIGKDIVVTMLDVNGYEVLDLGVDVPVERFVEATRTFKPLVVGLSGFLTLVYDPMKETIQAIRDENPGEIRFMIGGGQIDEQVMAYTGADGYGSDAIEAVKLCEKWI
ncbi:MAG: dihydropteroate synthase [Desulfobacteraceae bacterium]|uniref:Dihydropteroate synthase n=1 Tax=Candidatus Desulfacyla euxinica TaxID=2841693 RepID=A0A8J6N1F3_9DELT|nr:dihydropteroate synthase [Candidatus Desulfacyla euxinica]MBL6977762.1 dihydropteroate synthase [Desulfobacteraceae bacterium]